VRSPGDVLIPLLASAGAVLLALGILALGPVTFADQPLGSPCATCLGWYNCVDYGWPCARQFPPECPCECNVLVIPPLCGVPL
jgi:hypothetical protein